MIEKLNGTTETVNFTLASNIRLYHNNSAEDFPLHWHVPGEIICPIQNTYNVTVADEILYLKPHDILFIGSGELHSITAPKEGERYILNFSTAMFEPFHELALFCHPASLQAITLSGSTAAQRPDSGPDDPDGKRILWCGGLSGLRVVFADVALFRNHRPQAPSECTA